jgi:hypothetical protein
MATKAEKEHMSKVAAMGCYCCEKMGYPDSPAAIHHIRTGYGISQRASNFEVIPLCGLHHQHGGVGVAFHAGKKSWEINFGLETDVLAEINERLGIYE